MRATSDTLEDALGALARARRAVTELVNAVEPLEDVPAHQAGAVIAGELDRLRRRLELLDVAWRTAAAYRQEAGELAMMTLPTADPAVSAPPAS